MLWKNNIFVHFTINLELFLFLKYFDSNNIFYVIFSLHKRLRCQKNDIYYKKNYEINFSSSYKKKQIIKKF